jgi:hypothetical protein
MPPDARFPHPVKMSGTAGDAPRTPGMKLTGAVAVKPEQDTVPVEQLIELRKAGQAAVPAPPAVQFVPVPVAPAPDQSINSGLSPAVPAGPRK